MNDPEGVVFGNQGCPQHLRIFLFFLPHFHIKTSICRGFSNFFFVGWRSPSGPSRALWRISIPWGRPVGSRRMSRSSTFLKIHALTIWKRPCPRNQKKLLGNFFWSLMYEEWWTGVSWIMGDPKVTMGFNTRMVYLYWIQTKMIYIKLHHLREAQCSLHRSLGCITARMRMIRKDEYFGFAVCCCYFTNQFYDQASCGHSTSLEGTTTLLLWEYRYLEGRPRNRNWVRTLVHISPFPGLSHSL